MRVYDTKACFLVSLGDLDEYSTFAASLWVEVLA